jgi:hypothetical protein
MLEISFCFDWQQVLTPSKQPYSYPARWCPHRRRGKRVTGGSAVYRWVLAGQQEDKYIVGSTHTLNERVCSYETSCSASHIKIRKVFLHHVAMGGAIRLETLRFKPFTLNGTVFAEERLDNKFVRGALENLFQVQLERQLLDFTVQGAQQ